MPEKFLALDIDGTVWPFDLEEAWIEQLVHDGDLPKSAVRQNRAFLDGHLAGSFDEQGYLRFFLNVLRGRQLDALSEFAECVFQEFVKPRIYAEAIATIDLWRRSGAFVFLLTSANHIAAMPVGRFLGVDEVVATEFAFDSRGYLTDALIGPYCYGPGKVTKAQSICKRNGLRLADGAYFADSTSDIPMFEAVGKAVVVNPSNASLERTAHERGWTIERWKRLLDSSQLESSR